MSEQDIVIYTAPGVELSLPLDPERETVWASQAQIVELFGVDQSGVSRHLRNIFKGAEIDQESNMQKVHIARSDRPVTLYSLDVVLAVGYRANSARAIEFRRWASSVLKRYMLEGAALNERRLRELGQVVQVLSRSTDELVAGLADVLSGYLPGLRLIRDYDNGRIDAAPGAVPGWELTVDGARAVIDQLAKEFPADRLLGKERPGGLSGIIGAIYQSFDGQDLYPTVEEKAANLLYLVVKDHPLTDGNKRSAASLFVTFLARNGALHGADGQPRVSSNALSAVTLMVAMSHSREKELMVSLLVRMLSGERS